MTATAAVRSAVDMSMFDFFAIKLIMMAADGEFHITIKDAVIIKKCG